MKTCVRCGTPRDPAEFHKDPSRPDGRHPYCVPCRRAYRAALRVDAVARGLINRDHERDKRYRSRYGITAGTVDQLRARQGYRCAICDRHESQLPRGLAVDHDHATGYVRALLCLTCNTAIGLLEENADVLRAAIHYLLRAEELAASVHNET